MADPDEGRDIWETVMDDPTLMGGLGAVGGALAGRKLGRMANRAMRRNSPLPLSKWKKRFKERNGRSPTSREIQDYEYRTAGSGKRAKEHADNAIDAYEDAQFTAAESAKRFARGKGPATIGAVGGGAAGVGYSQGRRNRK